MKRTNDADEGDDQLSPGEHAQKMAHHESLAAKHRALADHHRQMHGDSINRVGSKARAGLMKAANSYGTGY